jgi:hypothetical protein
MHFRDSREVSPAEGEDGESILDILPEDAGYAMPEQALEDRELARTVMEMINALPAEQSSAVLLYYYERRSVKDIALIVDASESTVKSRLNYARKAIKSKVEEYERKTNVKLHSAAFLPFFLRFIFDGEKNATPIPALPAFAPAAAAAAAPMAAAPVATASASAAAGGIGIGVKLAAAVAAGVLLVGGAIFGISKLTNGGDGEQTETSRLDADTSISGVGGVDGSSSIRTEALTDAVTKPAPSYSSLTPSVGLEFREKDGYLVVESIGECTDLDVVIPETHDGKEVKVIGTYAFSNKNNFSGKPYSEITAIHIPPTVTRIENRAFWGCSSLETVDVWSEGRVYIEEYVFWECTSLKNIDTSKITLSSAYVFSDCTALTDFTLNSTVSSFSHGLLNECTQIKTLRIPADVKSLPARLVYKNPSLTDVYYAGTKAEWAQIEQNSHQGYDMLFPFSPWYEGTGDFTVHCSDGDISKADAVTPVKNTTLDYHNKYYKD